MRRELVVLTLVAGLAAAPALGQIREGTLRFSVAAQLVVADAEAAGRALSAWAEELGGFFVLRSLERVVLRLPAGRMAELQPALEKVSEEIATYAPSAVDLREEMAAVEAAIAGRQESLRLILT